MKAAISATRCCGLKEIHAFTSDGQANYYEYLRTLDPRELKESKQAYFAVTRRKDIKARMWFRLNGFKKKAEWKNPNTGRNLTLWVYEPGKKKSKKLEMK